MSLTCGHMWVTYGTHDIHRCLHGFTCASHQSRMKNVLHMRVKVWNWNNTRGPHAGHMWIQCDFSVMEWARTRRLFELVIVRMACQILLYIRNGCRQHVHNALRMHVYSQSVANISQGAANISTRSEYFTTHCQFHFTTAVSNSFSWRPSSIYS